MKHHTDPQRCPTWSLENGCVCDNCCHAWFTGCSQINNALCMWHQHGGEYTTKPFKFCPWCGEKIKSGAYELKPLVDVVTEDSE